MSFSSLMLRATEEVTPFGMMTALSGKLASSRIHWLKNLLIRKFIKSFAIDMEEVRDPDLEHYPTFNDFFIRRLKEEVRPLDPEGILIAPCDGTAGEGGTIVEDTLIQAKGLDYSLTALLGGDIELAREFTGGQFRTIYLSPSNYHRVHMPCDGTLRRTIHVPGRHFPVGSRNISGMPNLYTRNERLICIFDTPQGRLAVILVAAALVGGIFTTWDGVIKRRNGLGIHYYGEAPRTFRKGDELGGFMYGSTVVTLFAAKDGEIQPLKAGDGVRMGQAMLRLRHEGEEVAARPEQPEEPETAAAGSAAADENTSAPDDTLRI